MGNLSQFFKSNFFDEGVFTENDELRTRIGHWSAKNFGWSVH